MTARPSALILRAAGTNCVAETAYAFEVAGAGTRIAHVNELVNSPALLGESQVLAIPGGFSYGDDVSAGRILANELRFRMGDALQDFLEKGGLVIGICNGFQVLVKLGILPATNGIGAGFEIESSLIDNDSAQYEDRWICLETASSKCVFLKGIDSLYLPVAHGEGKFVVKEDAILEKMRKGDQIALRYTACDGGQVVYPWNPNGALDNIAGVCDPSGRVLGLMPHPERFLVREQHPRWTRENLPEEGAGLAVFKNAVAYFS